MVILAFEKTFAEEIAKLEHDNIVIPPLQLEDPNYVKITFSENNLDSDSNSPSHDVLEDSSEPLTVGTRNSLGRHFSRMQSAGSELGGSMGIGFGKKIRKNAIWRRREI